MIGLDTNVLVRYIVQDDPEQAAAATRLIESFSPEAPGFVSTVALVETVWVLTGAYKTPRPEIGAVIEGLLRARELVVDNSEAHYGALNAYQSLTVDYADALIAQCGRQAGCEYTATFDRRAAAGLMQILVS